MNVNARNIIIEDTNRKKNTSVGPDETADFSPMLYSFTNNIDERLQEMNVTDKSI